MKELYVFFSANYLPHVGGIERYTYGGGKEVIGSSQYGYIMDGNSQEDVYEAIKFFLKKP